MAAREEAKEMMKKKQGKMIEKDDEGEIELKKKCLSEGDGDEVTLSDEEQFVIDKLNESAEEMTEEDINELSEEEIIAGFELVGLSDEDVENEIALADKNPGDFKWITIGGRRIPIKGNKKNSILFPQGGYVGKKGGGQRWLGKKEAVANRRKLAAGMGILGAGIAGAYALKKGKFKQAGEALKKGVEGFKASRATGNIVKAMKKTPIQDEMGMFEAGRNLPGLSGKIYNKTTVKPGAPRQYNYPGVLDNIEKRMAPMEKAIEGGPKEIAKYAVGKVKEPFIQKKMGKMAPKMPSKRFSEDGEYVMLPIASLALSDIFSEEQIDDVVLSILHKMAPTVNFSEESAWENVQIAFNEETGEIEAVAFGDEYVDGDALKSIGLSMIGIE